MPTITLSSTRRAAALLSGAGLVTIALSGCAASMKPIDATMPTMQGGYSAPAEGPAAPGTAPGKTGSLIGSWESSDGQDKVFGGGGGCRGFFYDSATAKPLDIGGPSSCEQSSAPDESGRYRLKVTQGPNRGTYLVEFHGADAATVYTKSGAKLYDLTRF